MTRTPQLILGIDPATSCGWALLEDGKRLGSGTWDLSPKRHEGGGMRYLRCRRYLIELLDGHQVTALAYEEVRRHIGVDAAHVYGGIVAVIGEECERRKLPYRGIPVGTVKKLATGKGNADKAAMIAAANGRWSIAVEDDNEADALFIGLALAVELGLAT